MRNRNATDDDCGPFFEGVDVIACANPDIGERGLVICVDQGFRHVEVFLTCELAIGWAAFNDEDWFPNPFGDQGVISKGVNSLHVGAFVELP